MDPSHFNLQISSNDEMISWMKNKINKSTTIEDIVPMMNKQFSVSQLQAIMTSKIEDTFIKAKTEDSTSSCDNLKLRSIYLNSCAINEIFSTDIMVKIIKYLGDDDEYLQLRKLSKSFSKIFLNNPSIFREYTLKIYHKTQVEKEEKTDKQNTKIKKFYKLNINHQKKIVN